MTEAVVVGRAAAEGWVDDRAGPSFEHRRPGGDVEVVAVMTGRAVTGMVVDH